jgi:hypothetical protein
VGEVCAERLTERCVGGAGGGRMYN